EDFQRASELYVHPNHSGDVTSSADGAQTIAADAVTYAKMQNVTATDRILGRDSSGAGIVEEITPANLRTMINVADNANAYVHPNHSGDVTSSADGAQTIAADAVTYAKMQNVTATDRILGRDSSGAGIVEEITPANLRTMINVEDGATADQTAAQIKTALENGIDSVHYVNASIDNEHLADNAVGTSEIANDAVTADKLANSINSAIAANTAKTGITSGQTSAITANTAKVTNATHSGEVTGATALTIADNIIDEANLKVSNAPSNGYFLSAQSGNTGGMTWAEVDALPSQSSNSGKYLTTNGSAASWAVLDTDANTTTKGLYEHAHTIASNYTIGSGNNAGSFGAITINSNISVTIGSGSTWTIA
ncbi:hypothetical protein OAD60_04565, partial [Candidatus Thioglobus sp.]|nr:hypothetical protein [Candidatus Thioglobus sp.]